MIEKVGDRPYEEAFKEIEAYVALLEKGELSLDETLNHFEKAVRLIKYCKGLLDGAEKRVAILLETEDGELKLENLF
ncbi:MAG: exodeoxyribonuclease VII small subunit [Bacillota bacterium]